MWAWRRAWPNARLEMAIKSTIFKAQLQIADIDHSYYADHAFTLARHPSETDERMMVRLVAMALNAHQLQDTCHGDGHLLFGAGLSDPRSKSPRPKDNILVNHLNMSGVNSPKGTKWYLL